MGPICHITGEREGKQRRRGSPAANGGEERTAGEDEGWNRSGRPGQAHLYPFQHGRLPDGGVCVFAAASTTDVDEVVGSGDDSGRNTSRWRFGKDQGD